jgi:peptidoglycan hydrolase-like protein with peptidoglycan-binding domain
MATLLQYEGRSFLIHPLPSIGVSFGVDISSVQAKLNALGANPQLIVDGNFGPASRAAVMAFQKTHGLTPDGVIGSATLAALGLSGGGPVVTASELPDKPTPMTGEDVTKAISSGYQQVTKKIPTPQVLNLIVSQGAFETGNFGKGIHNFNFANKKFSSGDPHFQYFRCNEVIDGVNQFFDPPDAHCKFAAYANPGQAGEAFVRLLQGRPVWWNGLQTGNPTAFAAALKQGGYFTGDETSYAAGLERYAKDYLALAEKYAIPIGIAGLSSTILALGAGGAYLLYRYLRGV